MGSYIKFVFKYLFQSDDYLAELERLNGTSSVSLSSVSLLPPTSSALDLNLNDHQTHLTAAAETAAAAGATAHGNSKAAARAKQMSECQLLSRQLLAEHNRTNPLRSFADFEAFFKQQHQPIHSLATNDTSTASTTTTTTTTTISHTSFNSSNSGGSGSLHRLELHECFNQLQLQDYYAGYDILVGLRIASTLTILFVVFLMFVIYKTGYQEGRSQLSVVSATTKQHRDNNNNLNHSLSSQLLGGGGSSYYGGEEKTLKSSQKEPSRSGHRGHPRRHFESTADEDGKRHKNASAPAAAPSSASASSSADCMRGSGQLRSSITCGDGSPSCCHDFPLTTRIGAPVACWPPQLQQQQQRQRQRQRQPPSRQHHPHPPAGHNQDLEVNLDLETEMELDFNLHGNYFDEEEEAEAELQVEVEVEGDEQEYHNNNKQRQTIVP